MHSFIEGSGSDFNLFIQPHDIIDTLELKFMICKTVK